MIACSDFCDLEFHYECCGVVKNSGVDRTAMIAIRTYENVLYFCSNCKDLIKNISFNNLISKIGSLAEQHVNSNNIIDTITSSLKDVTSIFCKTLKEEMFAQRKIFEQLKTDIILTQNNSTYLPSLSDPPVNATVNADNIVSQPVMTNSVSAVHQQLYSTICGNKNNNVRASVKTVPKKYWFHLSRFDPVTTEADIDALMEECLGATNPRIVKLVPKGVDISKLEFVAFKIGIDESKKQEALNPNNWPQGVYLRPFIERRQNFLKKPPYHVNLQQIPHSIPPSPIIPLVPIHPTTQGT